jgi:RimJ/RimL family protein N-acetyltransferase
MNSKKQIPESTLEILARSIYKQSNDYGFQHADYLRLVNHILDATMREKKSTSPIEALPEKDALTKTAKMPLVGERIIIKSYDKDIHLELLQKWVGDEIGRYFLLSCLSTDSPKVEDMINSESSHIGIITMPDLTPIGIVAFIDFNCYQRRAEMRKMIGEKSYRGKGLAKEASRLWIEYGLQALDLHKIYLNTLDTNLRNIKLNEELGFKVEGILRNEVFYDGIYHDVLRMGLTE